MRNRGFTLLELMLAIAILCVLFVIAIPGFKVFLGYSKAEVLSSNLLQALSTARTEAVARGTTATLCPSSNGKTCGGAWKEGFIVLASENILFYYKNTDVGILNWRAFPNHKNELQFLSSGMTKSENGTFWYCVKGEALPAWMVVVNQAGRARLVTPKAGSNVDEKGKKITC